MFTTLTSLAALVASLPALILAAVFPPGPSVAYLQEKYRNEQVTVLIVPGHDPVQTGAVYKGIKEADLTLAIAYHLMDFLNNNPKINVVVSRERTGDYSPWLLEHIEERGTEMLAWRRAARAKAQSLMSDGSFVPVSGVAHNNAPSDIVTKLYAINHYANENNVDLVLHLHVNDEARKVASRPGKSTGYALYVPEPQLSGSATSRVIATSIAARLDQIAATSTLRQESAGVVDEQELIAIGPWGTRTGPSILIEYGYIYEPQFVNAKTRKTYLRDLGYQTYVGLEQFFASGSVPQKTAARK